MSKLDKRVDSVAWCVRGAMVLGALAVVAQVARLQYAPPATLVSFVSPRESRSTLLAPRGDLLDRRGRVLATTKMGSRVVVDPVHAGGSMDRTIRTIVDVLGADPMSIGPRIASAVAENARRAAYNEAHPQETKKLIRYLPVGDIVDESLAQRLASGRIPGVYVERAPVRVGTSNELVGGVIGKVGTKDWSTERVGLLGAEALFNERLKGSDGSLRYTHDAAGQPLWVERGAWEESARGEDVRLSIDLEIQRILYEELRAGAELADSSGARGVVVNPHTGEVLAMGDVIREVEGLEEFPWYDPEGDEEAATLPEPRQRPRYRVLAHDPTRASEPTLTRNRTVRDIYEPGSTFKPFAWALAKTLGLLPDDEVLEVEYGRSATAYGRILEDVTPKDELTWDDVLRYSSNVGMGIATERTPQHELSATVRSLGFGRTTGLGVMGEERGIVTPDARWTHWTQTSVGMGYEVAVTPVQMARAFSVFAREGELSGTLPELRLTASGEGEERGFVGDEIVLERVFSPDAARRVREPLRGVAERMDTNNTNVFDAPDPTYSMFGKSGTAFIPCIPPKGMRRPNGADGYYAKQYTSSFLVAAPAEDPQIVVLVVIDDPGPAQIAQRRHYGSWVAGPVVRRIVDRTLPYLGVNPDLGEKPEQNPQN